MNACARVVRHAGFEVVAGRSFQDVRRSLASRLPDALLTDLRLGDYNGLHLVLVAQAESPHTASVVFSDDTDLAMGLEAERCGARYLLTNDLNEGLGSVLQWLSANTEARENITTTRPRETRAHQGSF